MRTEEQKQAHAARERARRAANPDAHRLATRLFRERHPKRAKEIDARAKAKKREARDAERAATGWKPKPLLTPEERKARRKATLAKYNNTPERVAHMRQYTQDNWERHLEHGREWEKKNPEKARESRYKTYCRHRDRKLSQARDWYHRQKATPLQLAKQLYKGAKRRAKERTLEFTITVEWALSKVNAGICELSGLPFVQGDGCLSPMSPSLDRIDNDGGYTPDNCRLILWGVNSLKSDGTNDGMMKVIRAIVARNPKEI